MLEGAWRCRTTPLDVQISVQSELDGLVGGSPQANYEKAP